MDSIVIKSTAGNQFLLEAIPGYGRPIGRKTFVDGDDGIVPKETTFDYLTRLFPGRIEPVGMSHADFQVLRCSRKDSLCFCAGRRKRLFAQYILPSSNTILENDIPHMWRSADDAYITIR